MVQSRQPYLLYCSFNGLFLLSPERKSVTDVWAEAVVTICLYKNIFSMQTQSSALLLLFTDTQHNADHRNIRLHMHKEIWSRADLNVCRNKQFSFIFTFHFNRDSLKGFSLTEQGHFCLLFIWLESADSSMKKNRLNRKLLKYFVLVLTIICICRFQAIADWSSNLPACFYLPRVSKDRQITLQRSCFRVILCKKLTTQKESKLLWNQCNCIFKHFIQNPSILQTLKTLH